MFLIPVILFIIADVFKYKGLIVGCPTYNTQMYPEMEALLSKLASREIKGTLSGIFWLIYMG